jgi:radical SAM protein with 4Fe4S-binding SPASM domain
MIIADKFLDKMQGFISVPKTDYFPKTIILEVTNRCNLKCRHCHFQSRNITGRRPLGDMDKKIWQRVLDELKERQYQVNLITHGAGEPLLYKPLFDLLKKIKENPLLTAGFLTNGMFLNETVIQQLIDIQLDFIGFSIDGTKPSTHDFFRVNANLSQIEKNVDRLLEMKIQRNSDFPKLQFNMVGYAEILDQEMSFVKRWLPVAREVTVATFKPIGSRKLVDDVQISEYQMPACPYLWDQFVIAHDGRVAVCCEDFNVDVNIGSVVTNSIHTIYNQSDRLRYYRKKHLSHKTKDLKLCIDCQIPLSNNILNENKFNLDGMNISWKKTPAFSIYTKD